MRGHCIPLLTRERVQAPNDDPSEGKGKVSRSSWAEYSDKPYLRLLANRSGEPHLAGALHFDVT